MKRILIFLTLVIFSDSVYSQIITEPDSDNYFKLVEGSDNSKKFRIELFSDIDTTWNKWKLKGYNFGFNPKATPMYTTINGIISTPYMIQIRGNQSEQNKKRWGYHVFEGYASDNTSRITMLVNKHFENEKSVAEIYYYGTVYNHSEPAYNWLRIGSDVKNHSFLFSRDKALFYGSLKLSNTLTLGQMGNDNLRREVPDGDDERNAEESAKYVNYKALEESENGTIFYDKDHNIVVIKINGEWVKLVTEPLPKNINYDFE